MNGMTVGMAALFLCASIPAAVAGALTSQSFDSPALARPIEAVVYAPEGVPPEGGWPVVYLLHGHGGDERSWPDLGGIGATLDRMLAEGTLSPTLVVMPDAGGSWYVDSAAIGGPGDFETAISRDLRLAVEKAYPVRVDRGGRAIVGLSMGGFGALRLALAYAELYSATASLSGALWQNIPTSILGKSPEELKALQDGLYRGRGEDGGFLAGPAVPSVGDHFHGAFGTPFDARRFNAANVFTLLERRVAAGDPLPAIYLSCGDDDGYALWRGAFALRETLRAHGIPSELRVTDGGHDWRVWTVAVEEALLFIEQQRRQLDAAAAEVAVMEAGQAPPPTVTVTEN